MKAEGLFVGVLPKKASGKGRPTNTTLHIAWICLTGRSEYCRSRSTSHPPLIFCFMGYSGGFRYGFVYKQDGMSRAYFAGHLLRPTEYWI